MVAARMTLAQARTEVVKRLGMADDGQSSPELLAQITGQIASIQRDLCLEFRDLLPRQVRSVTLASGRQWYPLPCAPEGVVALGLAMSGAAPRRLTYGLTLDEYLDTAVGTPAKYDIRPTTGVVAVTVGGGGSGYADGASVTFGAPGGSGTTATGTLSVSGGVITGVVITDPGSEHVAVPSISAPTGSGATLTPVLGQVDALYLWRKPSAGGTLSIEFRDIPAATVADTAALSFDSEMVVAIAAGVLSTGIATALSGVLQAQAASYRGKLAARMPMRPAAQGMSMSPANLNRGG